MEANVAKGYIRKLEPGEIDDGLSWYLPHFPVVREDKETTKVRIVFDSAAQYGGISLNDTMLPGPKLQQDVFDVLLRFRSNPVALVADLTEMFSQVVMAKKDRQYHRFLWRGLDLARPPEVYEAMRLMFGDRASPYLAQYIVRQHAEDNNDDYPLAVAIILLQMYMDDIMTSLERDDEAIKACDQLIELLGKAGCKIRQWCSNRSKVLEDIPLEDHVANVNIEESELPSMKASGVQWNAETDMFTFKLSPPRDIEYTKRGLTHCRCWRHLQSEQGWPCRKRGFSDWVGTRSFLLSWKRGVKSGSVNYRSSLASRYLDVIAKWVKTLLTHPFTQW